MKRHSIMLAVHGASIDTGQHSDIATMHFGDCGTADITGETTGSTSHSAADTIA